MDIQNLPAEIILKIFDYFDTMTLFKCSKVNRMFRNTSRTNSLWRNIKILPQIDSRFHQLMRDPHYHKFSRFYSIPTDLIASIINNGCVNLDLSIYRSHGQIDKTDLPQKSGLKHLKLNNMLTPLPEDADDSFQQNQELFEKLFSTCDSLKRLGLNGKFHARNIKRHVIFVTGCKTILFIHNMTVDMI